MASATPTTKPLATPDVPDIPKENDAVKVILRLRPFNPREIEIHERTIEGKAAWEQVPLRSVIEFNKRETVFLDPERDFTEKERFEFDCCLWSIPDEQQRCESNPYADQSALMKEAGTEILKQAWKGYNTCFFAYGQTGSGKTHSMMGSDEGGDPGLIPRLCEQLFKDIEARSAEAEKHVDKHTQTFRVEVRYLEIYNEQVKDLLWHLSSLPADVKAKVNHDNMKIRHSPATGVFVEHLTAVEVDSWQRCMELISHGNASRSVAATKMNERSSRSHAIFKLSVTQITQTVPKKQFEKPVEHIRDSAINLVDLAGSERNKKTQAVGQRLKEAASINKSLLTLKMVIDTLVDNATKKSKNRPPYRESHLTSLLMDSLGGNSKTFMLVCASPHADNAEETLQTLKYGSRARQIVNVVHVNENAAGRMMMALEDELQRMRGELDKASSPEAVEQLRNQITEHESCIKDLEDEMSVQQQKIQKLQEQKEREVRARHATAFVALHALAQAKMRMDEADTEQQKLKRRLSVLRHDKESLDERQENAERNQVNLSCLIEQHKKKIAEAEGEVGQLHAKHNRLESYKRELLKTIADQQDELNHLKERRIACILRSRYQAAKIRLEFKKKLRELKRKHEEQVRAMTNHTQREQDALVKEFEVREEELERECRLLQDQYRLHQQELQKMEQEKNEQIKGLDSEVIALQQENRHRSEENAAKIQQLTADWEKKYNAMVEDMNAQYATLEKQWQEKHETDIQQEKAAFEQCREQWEAEHETTRSQWQKQLQFVVEEGTRKCEEAEAHWTSQFESKRQLNDQMREKLRAVEEKDKKYSEMLHRVLCVLDRCPNPKGKSAEYNRVYKILKTFQTEYSANQISKYKLQQLLRGDYELSRCEQVPAIGTDGGKPMLRFVSPKRAR